MSSVTLQMPVQLDAGKASVNMPLQTVMGTVGDVKKSLAAAYPGAVIEVQGEADVHLATADDRQTLGQAFTEYYGLDVAAGSVIAELRQSPDGAGACQLGLQGQKGFIRLSDTDSFRKYAFGPLSFNLSALRDPAPVPPAVSPAQQVMQADSQADPLAVTVLTQTGTSTRLTALSHWQVQDLKRQIQDRLGVPAYRQRLVYAGRLLEDRCRLEQYNIQAQCTLHLVPRPDTGARQFAHVKQKMGGIDIEDPYTIRWAGKHGQPHEVWVSAHDSLAVVRYAISLVAPELAGKISVDIPEVDMLRAQVRRANCDVAQMQHLLVQINADSL